MLFYKSTIVEIDVVKKILSLFCIVLLASCSNYSSMTGVTVSRSISGTSLAVGQTATLSIILSNSTDHPLEDVYFAEHIPEGLEVESLSVEVDGNDYSGQLQEETGAVDEIWAGCIPYRLLLRTVQSPEILGVDSTCRVTMVLRANAGGVYDLGRNNWFGKVGGTDPVFGWGEENLTMVVRDGGTMPALPLTVETGFTTLAGGAFAGISQQHTQPEFSGLLPDRVTIDVSAGTFHFDQISPGQSVGSATFHVDYWLPQDTSNLHASGEIEIDIVAESVGASLQCRCVVSQVPDSVVTVLQALGLANSRDDIVGQEVGAIEIAKAALEGGQITFSMSSAAASRMAVSWPLDLSWQLIDALFQHNAQGRVDVSTGYHFGDDPAQAVEESFPQQVPFKRADINLDGDLDISDVVSLLFYLFDEGEVLCKISADTNDDNIVDLADAIYLLGYLFGTGEPPPEPFEACGLDPTPGSNLYCPEFELCR